MSLTEPGQGTLILQPSSPGQEERVGVERCRGSEWGTERYNEV